MDAELTLEKAVNQAHQSEAVKKQELVVRNQISNDDSKLDAIKKKNFKFMKNTKSDPSKAGQPKVNGQISRSRCGR